MMALLFVAAWIACGVGTAGLDFAYFQSEFPTIAKKNYRSDLGEAWLMGLAFGPIGLVCEFFCGGFGKHGWRLK